MAPLLTSWETEQLMLENKTWRPFWTAGRHRIPGLNCVYPLTRLLLYTCMYYLFHTDSCLGGPCSSIFHEENVFET